LVCVVKSDLAVNSEVVLAVIRGSAHTVLQVAEVAEVQVLTHLKKQVVVRRVQRAEVVDPVMDMAVLAHMDSTGARLSDTVAEVQDQHSTVVGRVNPQAHKHTVVMDTSAEFTSEQMHSGRAVVVAITVAVMVARAATVDKVARVAARRLMMAVLVEASSSAIRQHQDPCMEAVEVVADRRPQVEVGHPAQHPAFKVSASCVISARSAD
jgi:hypothetical protein